MSLKSAGRQDSEGRETQLAARRHLKYLNISEILDGVTEFCCGSVVTEL